MTGGAGPRGWPRPALLVGLLLATAAAPVALVGGAALWAAVPVAVLAWFAGRSLHGLGGGVAVIAVGSLAAILGYGWLGTRSWASSVMSVLVVVLVTVVVPWWLGRVRLLQHDLRASERASVERRARAGERQAIARDVHDSLGHDLALIALRAGAWELSADSSDAERAAAADVRQRAGVATDRLHTLIGLLDGPEDVTAGTSAGGDLAELVARARASGLEVSLQDSEGAATWSFDVRQVVLRVVQEALTNASRHAPGSAVEVVARDGAVVEVEVVNRLPAITPPGHPSTGTGLLGLAHRVQALGGAFTAGPDEADGGVFRVRAQLPRDLPETGAGGTAESATDGLRALSRHARRRRVLTALLPVGLALALLGTLTGTHVVTVLQTALPPQRYAALELGRPRSELVSLLPPKAQQSAPPVVQVVPAPEGSRCELYQARASVFDLGQSMFRLCFDRAADPRLIAKDHLLVAG